MKKSINTILNTITFTFDGLEPLTLKMADVNPNNVTYAALHGLSQRCGDAAAISKSADNAYAVTEKMRRDAVEEMVNHYIGGSADWNLKVSEKKAPQNATWLALATKRGVTYEVIAGEKAAADLAELAAM